MKSEPKKKKNNLTLFYHMSLAVGKRSSSRGKEDSRQWRQSRSTDNGGDFPPLAISPSLSSFDENQMVCLCVTFKFVCFDGIEEKKLADEVVRENRERKKEKKKKEKERELCGMFWSLEEVVGKKRKE